MRRPMLSRRLSIAWLSLALVSGCADSSSVGRTPTPTSTATASPSVTSSPSSTPSRTPTPSPSPSPTVSPSPTPTVRQDPILGDAFSLRLDGGVLTLARDGAALLTWPVDAFQLGVVDALDTLQSYDPYPIVAGIPLLRPVQGLRWLPAVAARVVHVAADRFELHLEFAEGKTASVIAAHEAEGRFSLRFAGADAGPPIAFYRLRPRVDDSEAFYGLGEYLDSVNHRGKIRAMQIEVDSSIESFYNEAHVPIPFVIGTRGWGLFVESPYPGAFDVAASAPDIVEATFGTAFASTEGLLVHLFAAAHPLDVTKHYYDVTGYPTLPARWALGPWVWRDENRDQAQVENDLATIRALDLATTAIWIDRPYASGVNSFDFKPSQFPDPDGMIARAHDLGFRVALWHTPYLDPESEAVQPLRQQAVENGYLPPRGLRLGPWGIPLDLTNPEAFAWWQDLIRRYTDMGIEGFKLDYAEEVVAGLLGNRLIWQFHDGSDERTMHSRYQLFYHRAYAELLPEDGGFLLCRAGTYGSQRSASVIWPGDLDANMAKHREVVTDGNETYVAVGGLPASVIAGLTLGPSGFPFYGADTGGYQHAPPDKETFTRWFEQTALSSVMQIGTNTNDVAWEPTPENGFDEEMLGWYRIYTRLHLRLFPYEWTYAQRIATDGRPIQRALGLVYPELGVHPDDTYMFGEHLLVAPVVERGQRRRPVILPPGGWFDWWTGELYEGGRTVVVDAPLDTLPLFLREGGIVPLLRPTIDTLAPTTAPEMVESYATTPGLLYARIAPGPASEFVVFDGTVIRQRRTATGIDVEWREGVEFAHGVEFDIVGFDQPVSAVMADGEMLETVADAVQLDAAERGWLVDGGTLRIKLPPGQHAVSVTTTRSE